MNKRILYLSFFLTVICVNVQAQDIHFSLFNMSPLSLNPANTGAFEGSFRVGGIYRDQFRSVTSNQFSTPMFYIDAPIASIGKKKKDWIGIGAMLFQDKAGLAAFQTGSFQLSAALHHSFDDNYKNVLTFGIQGGPVNRQVDLSNADLHFADEATNGAFGGATSADRMLDGNSNYTDFAVGLKFKSVVNEKMDYHLGVSLGHLLQPDVSLSTNAFDQDMRIQAHAGLTRMLNEKFSLSPSIYYTTLGPADQFQLQALGGYEFNEDFQLNFGTGYRFGDALELILGADIKDIKVAASYDLTVSELSNAKTGGAFEIALGYIFKIYKEVEVKPIILCPHL